VPIVKVCCISSKEEADQAIAAGASALGLVSKMPSGPGVISDEAIAEIARNIPPSIARFLLTSRHDAESIIEQHNRCRTTTLQLVDRVPVKDLSQLRSRLPGINLVQVIHVTGSESIDEACALAPYIDALLLDSGNQELAIKELGGTGRVHDWTISSQIREKCGKPIYLAGGLNSANVRTAIRSVNPFGLDICSGVRTAARLDTAKLTDFFDAVSNAGIPSTQSVSQ
jgi:phosphoribosylanthranilate isomerase